jgi:hypothetical protein
MGVFHDYERRNFGSEAERKMKEELRKRKENPETK